ncbi:hypothetical protein [Rhodococcus sp. ARC_M13]|uniref:hypothetical protein n=1 Tax=Rhodococcus sp. ARC_M13 TaxID=2928855 RepID=UPI0035B03E1D
MNTSETPLITDLLAAFDLTDVVVTADALHCHRATAEYFVGRGWHYVFTVKNNQIALRGLPKILPWNEIPVSSSIGGRAHGRRERRTIEATEVAGGFGSPHAVAGCYRFVSPSPAAVAASGGGLLGHLVADGVGRSDAGRGLGSGPLGNREPAALGSGHHVRRGPLRRPHRRRSAGDRHGPQHHRQVLRLAGHDNITAVLRHHSRNPHRPVGLPHEA